MGEPILAGAPLALNEHRGVHGGIPLAGSMGGGNFLAAAQVEFNGLRILEILVGGEAADGVFVEDRRVGHLGQDVHAVILAVGLEKPPLDGKHGAA